ncbi:ParH-like protein [Streptomyces sp. B1866]|uniref:ParH-like protein n=1 Tax=Streptomyces sp. B1866 TaxID=3075431 RepID=UPI002890D688|nr:ParH-like protein [Streptomyces sp. B1866]MDT3397277.1 ParH-like protein [Streptomyces sp. B1866]
MKAVIPVIPDPFDVDEMLRLLAEQRGRAIHLVPWKLPADSLCGMWAATPSADYLFYEQDTTPAHQDHIKLHEMGHMLLSHGPNRPLRAALARTLLSDLPAKTLPLVLGQPRYSDPEERLAETFASLVLTEVSRRLPETGSAVSQEAAEAVRRVENTLRTPRKSLRAA